MSLGRLEGGQKVTGTARYTSDIELPGQLYAGILRSPHAHARVKRVDTSGVWNSPGVQAVLAHGDTEVRWYAENAPLLAEHARFAGDEIAALAATSEENVLSALRAFRVDYERLPPVPDIEAAKAGNVLLHGDKPDNRLAQPEVYERGDVAAGFAAADVIVEAVYTTPAALHNALEPHGCNAWWDGPCLNLWVSTQGIFSVRDMVAEKLGLPQNRVRVHAEHVGGGFGAKQVAWKQTVLAALLARRCGRPVKLMLDRPAENLAVGNRNATRQHVRLGARRDGRLCAIDVRAELAYGAYAVAGEGIIVTGCYETLYRCDNVRTEQTAYYTTTGPAVAFRAPGYVEGSFGLEQAMDELARRLNLDPFELRARNYAETDQKTSKPYSSPEALQRCCRTAQDTFEWNKRPKSRPGGNRKRGRGMAASIWLAGSANPPAYAEAVLLPDAGLSVITGGQDIGTGIRTSLAQIAADALLMDASRVHVAIGDTVTELRCPTSAGSATLPTLGPAVLSAARALRDRILRAAADYLETGSEPLTLEAGKVSAGPGKSVTLKKLAAACLPGSLRGSGSCERSEQNVATRTFAAQCVEVEVDMDTGELSVLEVVCAPDCGNIVNRKLADSQVLGGVIQGLGFAVSEGRVLDPHHSVMMNANLEEYLIPTVCDAPLIKHAVVGLPDTAGNELGIKGLGEPPMIAVAPAIANAVFDATGLRLHDLPLTPKRILDAIAARGSSR